MRIGEIVKAAKENDVDLMWAVTRRQEYLTGRYFDLRIQMKEDVDYLNNQASDDFEIRVWSEAIIATAHELHEIKIEQKRLKDWIEQSKSKPGQITEEMIATAKAFPIDSVIQFVRGQVSCPFHEDKNPSAYHGTRTNRLMCPVCNKSWSALDVLMMRDGMTFIDAVKELNL